MEKREFILEFSHKAQLLPIEVDESQIEQFYTYMELLLQWNEKMNLTAIVEPKEIILKHFIDSVTILKYIDKNKTLIDIGTGAGFPGIPVKIMRPDIEVTLLDSLNKRIHFLEEVINQLRLKNIEIVHARIEEYGKNRKYRESYDIATSRAVANLTTLSEYMLPMVKVGGISICMKGAEIEEEFSKSQKAIDILGGKIQKVDTFILPKSDNKRNIILIEKRKLTPSKYPRKPGTPSKEPLYN